MFVNPFDDIEKQVRFRKLCRRVITVDAIRCSLLKKMQRNSKKRSVEGNSHMHTCMLLLTHANQFTESHANKL